MMKPSVFFEAVVRPNIEAVEDRPADLLAVVNAVLTLDALVGILFAHLRVVGHPAAASLKGDDAFRDQIADRCPGYAAIRDTAAALKHGRLDRGKKARVIRTPDQIQTTENVLSLYEVDDEIGGHVAVLCLDGGIDGVRADDAMAATCQEILPLLGASDSE